MGDDVNIIVPQVEEEEPEQTLDDVGMELVHLLEACQSRCDQLVLELGAMNARITAIEGICAELGGRVWAEVEHSHTEFALTGHEHPEYARVEHTHEEEHKERDHEPEKQHFWYRRIGA